MYTSGTTGLPGHPARTSSARCTRRPWPTRGAWRQVRAALQALVFNGAMVTMLPLFMCGGTFVVLPRVRRGSVHRDRRAQSAWRTSMLVPSQIVAILDAPGFDPSRLRSLADDPVALGAPLLHSEHKDQLNRLLPDRFYELYGLTEGRHDPRSRRAKRIGQQRGVPPPFYEMRICGEDGRDPPAGEVGEIWAAARSTMPGYCHDREALTAQTLAGGWLHTGDLGYVDGDGYLFLVDRKKGRDRQRRRRRSTRRTSRRSRRTTHGVQVAVFGIPHDKGRDARVRGRAARAGRRRCAAQVDQRARRREVPAGGSRDRDAGFPAQCRGQDAEARDARPRSGRARDRAIWRSLPGHRADATARCGGRRVPELVPRSRREQPVSAPVPFQFGNVELSTLNTRVSGRPDSPRRCRSSRCCATSRPCSLPPCRPRGCSTRSAAVPGR